MKKGFTLIELLAVIVILAIIALIATPIMLNVIDNSKKSAITRSAENYLRAAKQSVAAKQLDGTTIVEDGNYIVMDNEKICLDGDKTKTCLNVEVDGSKPKEGSSLNIKEGIMESYNLNFGTKTVAKYLNGTPVYFNVDTGKKCDNYTESQSKVGVKSGCMKFYAFNDSDKSDTLNLLLDHSIVAYISWMSKDDYIAVGGSEEEYEKYGSDKGPITVLKKLKEITKNWQGTIEPKDYTMDQRGKKSNAYYKIDYSGYKARLITANDIAKITGNTSWDEAEATLWYYFDSKNKIEHPTNQGESKYAWLFDYIGGCTSYGCNVPDASTNGYWTASSCSGSTKCAWYVTPNGSLGTHGVTPYSTKAIRPVIAVSKSNLN